MKKVLKIVTKLMIIIVIISLLSLAYGITNQPFGEIVDNLSEKALFITIVSIVLAAIIGSYADY